MKLLFVLVSVLTLAPSCASQKQANLSGPITTPSKQDAEISPASIDQTGGISIEPTIKVVPREWKEVDFRNFLYQTNSLRGVRLKDGRVEKREGAGGSWVDFEAVDYVDLDGDGAKDALVHLAQVLCGVSCDGGSHLFYFYSIKKGKPILLTRLESGSLGYGCGLKSFTVKDQQLTMEVFWKCHQTGVAVTADSDSKEIGKFDAKSFTRFLFKFRKRLALVKREIFPYGEGDVRGYTPAVLVEP